MRRLVPRVHGGIFRRQASEPPSPIILLALEALKRASSKQMAQWRSQGKKEDFARSNDAAAQESSPPASGFRVANAGGTAASLEQRAAAKESAAPMVEWTPATPGDGACLVQTAARELMGSIQALLADFARIETNVRFEGGGVRGRASTGGLATSVGLVRPFIAIKMGEAALRSTRNERTPWRCAELGAPDVCAELVDPTDPQNHDINACLQRHLILGTREVIRFDPTGVESQSVRIWRRESGRFRSLRFASEEPVRSPALGLFWVWRERNAATGSCARLVLSRHWRDLSRGHA